MNKAPQYGPQNPHPLSTLKTELVWEGKYDEYGRRREVDVAGCAMPMQRIETIDQPRSEAAAAGAQSLLQFEKKTSRVDDFRNRLIWGDNKLVMASLLAEFKGKIDLIYIDPPFDVGADFTMSVALGDERETVEKDQSALEMVAYRDTWGKDTDSYLHTMYERFVLMRNLLSERGTICVHCDWHVGFFLRALMNELFGKENFLNEIVWYYYNKLHDSRKKLLPRAHDAILRYAKCVGTHVHNPLKERRENPVKKLKYHKVAGEIQNIIGPDGKAVTYISEEKTVDDVWRIRCLQPANIEENLLFETQKPEDLIERLVVLASNEGDLVADFFCGSGTTGAVAEKLGRRWIMADLGRFAIHTTRKRLIDVQRTLSSEGKPYRAFDVFNLGRYERQWWQKEQLHGADDEHRRVVLEFFRAEPLANAPSPLLHGRKAGAYCHVDGIDSIFTRGEARELAKAVAAAGGREAYVLAWEFEMDLRLTTAALEKELGVKLKLIQIPREIMERNRKNPPPFLEMAVLEAEPIYRRAHAEAQGSQKEAHAEAQSSQRKEKELCASAPLRELSPSAPLRELSPVDIKLTKFMPSLAEVPSKELEALKERAVTSGFDFIDFWAVDFDWPLTPGVKGWQPGKPFNHHWQDYRTRKDRSLKTVSEAGFQYPKKGRYTACVKVVDVFGCDTSITVEVRV